MCIKLRAIQVPLAVEYKPEVDISLRQLELPAAVIGVLLGQLLHHLKGACVLSLRGIQVTFTS